MVRHLNIAACIAGRDSWALIGRRRLADEKKNTRNKDLKRFYAEVGEIIVRTEHLNRAMNDTLWMLLVLKGGLDEEYAKVVLAGYNIESMRRYWTALVKATFENDTEAHGIIDSVSDRIDRVNGRRNDIVHRLWYTDFPSDVNLYSRFEGIKTSRAFKRKSPGGIDYSVKKAHQFREIIAELHHVRELINIVMIAASSGRSPTAYLEYGHGNRLQLKKELED